MHIASISILVREYDEALHYYTKVLGFELIEDTALAAGKRWLLIAPPGSGETRFLLVRAEEPRETAQIGNQCGGRVWLILATEDFETDYRIYQSRGVHFCEPPRQEAYGTVAIFEDLYGNRWDLFQPKTLTKNST